MDRIPQDLLHKKNILKLCKSHRKGASSRKEPQEKEPPSEKEQGMMMRKNKGGKKDTNADLKQIFLRKDSRFTIQQHTLKYAKLGGS